MAVATSSHKSAFCLKSSRNAELFDMFEGKIICGDSPSVAHGKPAPDIFLAAAKELLGHDLKDPSNCLVFEDAPSGVKAGLAAGMQVCWIPDRNLTMDEELKAKAHCIIYSMEDFDPVQFGLPPYSSSSGGD